MTKRNTGYNGLIPGSIVKACHGGCGMWRQQYALDPRGQRINRAMLGVSSPSTIMLVVSSIATSGLSHQCLVIDSQTGVLGWVWASHVTLVRSQ